MKGFDPQFRDFPQYILDITKEIWEDRGLSTLRRYYAQDIIVRSPTSVVHGAEAVIAATLGALAEFPDRQLYGEDIIWSGDEDAGFLSSHRSLTQATHAYEGLYGAPTGRKLTYRVIADCAAKDNVIYDEWLVRDQGSIVRQIGIDPKRYAADRIAAEGGPERSAPALSAATNIAGPYCATGNDDPVGRDYAAILGRMMEADLAAVRSVYDRAVQIETPGGFTGHGWTDVDRFWLRLRSAFPNAIFRVHHTIGRSDPLMPPRAALRWSLEGRHEGPGAFGPASGADVYVLGISHAEFGPWGLRREWVLYDETAIWKQILLRTG